MDTKRLPKQAVQYRPKGRKTKDDLGRDGGTKFTLRIKEQKTRPNLNERDDEDDEKINNFFKKFQKNMT
jgi:hypothetical protein